MGKVPFLYALFFLLVLRFKESTLCPLLRLLLDLPAIRVLLRSRCSSSSATLYAQGRGGYTSVELERKMWAVTDAAAVAPLQSGSSSGSRPAAAQQPCVLREGRGTQVLSSAASTSL